MLTIKIKETGKDINLDNITNNVLKEIAIMVSEDITNNMESERVVSNDIGGNYRPAPPLDSKYRSWKIKQGLSGRIFRKEENMINEVVYKKSGKLSYKVFMKGVSEAYAEFVNDKRKFFAISNNLLTKIETKFKSLKVNA